MKTTGQIENRNDLEQEESRVDEVYREILKQIIRGDLPSGTELKSTQLSTEMKTSRTPVVQALARLSSDGIISQQKNQRAVVADGAEQWLVDLHEMRILLEPKAASLAAGNMGKEQLEYLHQLAQEAKPEKSGHWTRAAYQFDYHLHIFIAEASGNLPLKETICKCMSFKHIAYEIGEDSMETLKRGYDEHLKILDAIESGDGEIASTAMLYHLQNSARFRSRHHVI